MQATEGRLRIERRDGGVLVLDGTGLAEAFFTADPSSVGEHSFDSLAGRTAPARIESADITAINRTMRARSAHVRWADLVDTELPWLRAIPADLDLIDSSDAEWDSHNGGERVRAALVATVRAGVGVSVATKMLHLKRPRLFPVLDQLVAQVLGAPIPETGELRTARAAELVLHLRAQGRANLRALLSIQQALSARFGIERSLVRILDGVLWLSHPVAAVQGAPRTFECRVGAAEESRSDLRRRG